MVQLVAGWAASTPISIQIKLLRMVASLVLRQARYRVSADATVDVLPAGLEFV